MEDEDQFRQILDLIQGRDVPNIFNTNNKTKLSKNFKLINHFVKMPIAKR